MTTFPKYPAYKDSGAAWLGEVPEHWGVDPLRACAELSTERNRSDLPVLSVYREYGVIPKDSRDDNHNATSLDTSNYKVIRPGDLAVNKMKAWQGSLGVSEHHGIVSPAYITCRIDQDKVNGRYLHYLLRSRPLVGALDAISYGVRVGQWDMRWEDFKLVQLTYPPRAEQDRIVAFLDEKTAQIDALIAKKQRQIELLDEQKDILINRAVTRGLHPNPDLQDSGIPWIGPIPNGWRVVPLRYLLAEPLTNGLFKTKQFFGEGTRLVNVGDVYAKDNVITPSSLERVRATGREKASYQVQKGDIFFVRSSLKLEGTGASSMMPDCDEDTVFECHVIRGRPKSTIVEPEYLIRYLNAASVRSALVADAKTVTMSTLDQQAFLRLPILVPPKDEQKPICEALRAMFEKFNQAKRQIESQIQTLQTLRSTLIAHAVTGKMRVE